MKKGIQDYRSDHVFDGKRDIDAANLARLKKRAAEVLGKQKWTVVESYADYLPRPARVP